MGGLPPHADGLSLNGPKRLDRISNAYTPDYDKQSREYDVGLFPSRDGGGLLNDDGYVFMGIAWCLAGLLVCIGTIRVIGGKRRAGIFLLLGGIVLDDLATASGVIGCLPWNWWGCLHDGQEHDGVDEVVPSNKHFLRSSALSPTDVTQGARPAPRFRLKYRPGVPHPNAAALGKAFFGKRVPLRAGQTSGMISTKTGHSDLLEAAPPHAQLPN